MKTLTVVIPLGKEYTLDVLNSLGKQKNNVTVLIERGPNPSVNRNNGTKKAKTPFVAFVNSHTILPEDWVERVAMFFKEHPEIAIVGGPQYTAPKENFLAHATGYTLGSLFGGWDMRRRYTKHPVNLHADENYLTSANLVCRKEVFKKIQFDETLYPGEDPKFLADAKQTGFGIAYSPEVFVYHKRRNTLRALVKQLYQYGNMRAKKESLFKLIRKPYFFGPTGFLFYLLFLPILLSLHAIFILPLIAYVCLAVIFTVYESFRHKSFLSLFAMPFLFLLIHLSYGAGFFMGVFASLLKKHH